MSATDKTSAHPFTRDDLLGVTHIRIEFSDSWLPVWRLNQKTVTVTDLWPWASSVEFADIIAVLAVTK